MSAIITVLHVIACIFLIAVVLLQRGKGAQIGAVFGGGAGATVVSLGAGNFLTSSPRSRHHLLPRSCSSPTRMAVRSRPPVPGRREG